MDYEFESIIPWNGEHDTGRDARQKLDRNFAKIKSNFEELAGSRFVTADFFARLFGIEGEDGEAVTVNDLEAGITAIQAKFGLYSSSFLSALGRNPDSGGAVAGSDTLAGLTDVALTNPANGQALVYQNGKWVNQTIQAGLDESALAQYLATHKYATQEWVLEQLEQNPDTGYVTKAFFARLFGIEGEDGAAVDVNDMETVITAIQAKFGFYSGQWVSAKGKNPSSGGVSAGIDEEQLEEYLTTNRYATQQWVQQQGYLIAGNLGNLNAGSATRLQTARTLWGQTFNGTQNVSGSLTGTGSITPTSNNASNIGSSSLRYATVYANNGNFSNIVTAYEFVANNANMLKYGQYSYKNVLSYMWEDSVADCIVINIPGNTNHRQKMELMSGGIGGLRVTGNLVATGYINAGNYLQVGSARLYYDSSANALYVQKSDGTACGFYATGFVSAGGSNPESGGVSAGLDEEQLAEYLSEHGYATQTWVNNQGFLDSSALSGYATQQWVNSQGFAKDVKWSNLAGRPTPLIDGTYFYDREEVASDWNNYDSNGAYAAYADINSFSQDNAPTGTYNYGLLASFSDEKHAVAQIYFPHNGVAPKFRLRWGSSAWSGWATLALTSSKVADASHADSADTATVATRLQTARTLWGQTFNGTQNVSGSLTGTGSITPTSNNASNIGSSSLRYATVYANNGNFSNIVTAYEFVATNAGILKYSAFAYKDVISYAWSDGTSDCLVINIPGSSNRSQKMELMAGGIGGLRVTGNLVATGYINAGNYLQVGSARLYYDSSAGALYVRKSDGTACGFYATGFVSAGGKNSSAGGSISGIPTLDGLNFSGSGGIKFNQYGNVNSDASTGFWYIGKSSSNMGISVAWSNMYVGVGTTAPSYKLHVSGSAYATGGFNNGSDIRYKHILRDIKLTTAQVADSPSFIFTWIDNTDTGEQAGTSAQYWEQFIPQIISRDNAGRLSMQYDKAALASVIAVARTVVDHETRIRNLEAALKVAV